MAVTDEEKRKSIVNEIESWRRSKLLPEQYCDFLQNIYLDDLNERPVGPLATTVKKIGRAPGKMWFLAFGIFALICFVVLHFSVFPLALQIAVAMAVGAGFAGFGARLRKRNPKRALLLIGSGMGVLLGLGAIILKLHGWSAGAGPIVLLSACALLWIASGIAFRFALLHWCGWMAIVVLYAILLSDHVSSPSLLEVQVFWIPAALLFGWLSWFMHVRNKSIGGVLFATALVLWFMPEVYAALFAISPEWIQLQLLLKIAIAGIGMFKLRKQWMEWVV